MNTRSAEAEFGATCYYLEELLKNHETRARRDLARTPGSPLAASSTSCWLLPWSSRGSPTAPPPWRTVFTSVPFKSYWNLMRLCVKIIWRIAMLLYFSVVRLRLSASISGGYSNSLIRFENDSLLQWISGFSKPTAYFYKYKLTNTFWPKL